MVLGTGTCRDPLDRRVFLAAPFPRIRPYDCLLPLPSTRRRRELQQVPLSGIHRGVRALTFPMLRSRSRRSMASIPAATFPSLATAVLLRMGDGQSALLTIISHRPTLAADQIDPCRSVA